MDLKKLHSEELLRKIKNAPLEPGCYLYKNVDEKIIYVGKAKNLRNRVRSYFNQGYKKDPKTISLVSKIADVEYIVTYTEVEALILENTLIKENRPKYNIFMRDDKTYPYIRITNELFPQIFITRKLDKDGSKYFGPYTDAGALRETLKIIKKLFAVRSCSWQLDEETVKLRKVKLCLDYHIKRCDGPCQGLISSEEYGQIIYGIVQFLNGKTNYVLQQFREKMETASRNLKFEEASKYRNHFVVLQNYSNRQAVELNDFIDRDMITIISEEDVACAVVFRIREGKLVSKDSFFMEGISDHELSEIMRMFLQDFYEKATAIPQELLVNIIPNEKDTIEQWLRQLHGRKVIITKPVRTDKLRLLKMAERNASLQTKDFLLKKSQKIDYTPKSLIRLQTDLLLPKPPKRIEAFDISNIRGKFAVGSLVTFIDGKAKKSEYRRFKIKTVQEIDDFSMMAEVVKRRFSRQIREEKELPDLILVDGGKGQLSASKQVLNELNLNNIPIIGLAKRLEEIFLPDAADPVLLRKDSPSLLLLQKIRDEAHRFAIYFHRKLREKGEITSELDSITGLGANKKKELWNRFKSISNMRAASVEELCSVNGIGPKLADKIWKTLHHGSGKNEEN